LFDYLTSFVHV